MNDDTGAILALLFAGAIVFAVLALIFIGAGLAVMP